MSDRELLELAAKAAGVRYDGYDEDAGCDIWFVPELSRYTEWNPLADDGDALRLAVKLQITVCNEQVTSGVVYCTRDIGACTWSSPEVHSGENESEVIAGDYAATRRAIVMAAAAIGSQP